MKKTVPNFVALDIGHSKIATLAANINKQGMITVTSQLLGYSEGFKAGSITNLEAATTSIINSLYFLEQEYGKNIKEVALSLSSSVIHSYYLQQKIKLGNQPVSTQDINRLVQKTLADFKSKEQEIVHYFPLEFVLDQDKIVDNPIGMYGYELRCCLHVIVANSLSLINLTNCLAKCHVEVSDIILDIYASGTACLTPDEKKLGVIMIDIGSTTSSFGIFCENQLLCSGSVPLGSWHITSDIAKVFLLNIQTAERLKILYGSAVFSSFDKDITIRIDEFEQDNSYDTGLTITSNQLIEVIQPRVEEILLKIKERYEQAPVNHLLAHCLVITGGGASLPGIKNLATDILQKQIRIAKPETLPDAIEDDNSYRYANTVGMIKLRALKYQKNSLLLDRKQHGWIKKSLIWIKENI